MEGRTDVQKPCEDDNVEYQPGDDQVFACVCGCRGVARCQPSPIALDVDAQDVGGKKDACRPARGNEGTVFPSHGADNSSIHHIHGRRKEGWGQDEEYALEDERYELGGVEVTDAANHKAEYHHDTPKNKRRAEPEFGSDHTPDMGATDQEKDNSECDA